MNWKDGEIHDCVITELRRFADDRGWLSELFRVDERPDGHDPAMTYISETMGGVARGPHAHVHQSDLFAFFDGTFRIFLWDDRDDSPSFGVRQIIQAGRERPLALRVPPGVVHAYRNMGKDAALILNMPDRLYAGPNRSEPVDEVRYEDQPDSPYKLV